LGYVYNMAVWQEARYEVVESKLRVFIKMELIDQFVKCLVDSARAKTNGPAEENLPLYTAQEIKKELNRAEHKEAARRAVIELLKNNFPNEAMAWIGEFKEFPGLINDAGIMQQAQKNYQSAKDSQNEIAEQLKAFFNL